MAWPGRSISGSILAIAETGSELSDSTWFDFTVSLLQQAERVSGRIDFAKLSGPDERACLISCRAVEEARRANEEGARQL